MGNMTRNKVNFGDMVLDRAKWVKNSGIEIIEDFNFESQKIRGFTFLDGIR